MTDTKLTNSVFKLLPLYEESYELYYKYLARLIIELQGCDTTEALEQTIIALKGLYKAGDSVDHTMVKRIVMRYSAKLAKE